MADRTDDDDFILEARVLGPSPNADPIETVVVGDKRNTILRRLIVLGLALLVLFFMINGYIQSAKNGRRLNQANKTNAELTEDISDLSDSISDLSDSNRRQTKFIEQLQDAIRAQNRLLRQAGITIVRIPASEVSGQDNSGDASQNRPSRPGSRPQHGPNQSDKPDNPNKPDKPDRPNQPDEPPGLVESISENVCELTGICF